MKHDQDQALKHKFFLSVLKLIEFPFVLISGVSDVRVSGGNRENGKAEGTSS